MQTTYAHPDVFTAGTGVRTLNFIVGANGETVMVDLDQRSVSSKCELFGATTTVALGKNPGEVEITVHTAFNAELKFGIDFETGVVTPLGDSVISSSAPSMASFMWQKYLAGVDKTFLVTQGSPPPATSSLLHPKPLLNDYREGLDYALKPRNPKVIPKIILDPAPDRLIQPHEGFGDLKP